MSLSDIPNAISILRILIVYPVVVYLYQEKYNLALALFVFASISDLVDGYLARRYNWTSKLGGWLDPIADKLLINSVFLTLYIIGLVPAWLLILVLGRDLLIVGCVVYYYYKIEKVSARPTWISKVNTFVQLVLVFLILSSLTLQSYNFNGLPQLLLDGGMWIVLGLTIISGAGYINMGIKALMIRKKDVL